MNLTSYPFGLQEFKQRKFSCPACGHKRFVRYVWNATQEFIGEDVGKCDRQDSCTYHKTPKEHFVKHPEEKKDVSEPVKAVQKPVEYLSLDYVRLSMQPAKNNLITYLNTLFGEEMTESLRLKYLIGTSKYRWKDEGYISDPGATVFWQIDTKERVHYGKVMLYNQTGKRVKEPKTHITSARKLIPGKEDMEFRQCLFGEHLLAEYPTKKVAIVESEKTAIICSAMIPDCIWLATGGKNGAKCYDLNVVKPLANRAIVLFPDLNADWKDKAEDIRKLVPCQIHVSDFLEKIATDEQRANGLDLADYLIKRDEAFGWALTEAGYPVFWDHKPEYEVKKAIPSLSRRSHA